MSDDKKRRTAIPRQSMPTRTPRERRLDFVEVESGLPLEVALREAQRCLGCAHPACVGGCPVGVKIREDNALPAITGRVCPQERQCEGGCVLGKRFEPVAIGWLERFVADRELEAGAAQWPEKRPPTGCRVAIVGSGPAGLACAAELVLRGHEAQVFEALEEPGGVLAYGIPAFRLPADVVRAAIDALGELGVSIATGVRIDSEKGLSRLIEAEGFDAVFVATGAGVSRRLGVPGEDLHGVIAATEYLARSKLLAAWRCPEFQEVRPEHAGRAVVVVGGGNTAIDVARSAVRSGAESVHVLYRRSRTEMPARTVDVRHAEEEGVEIVERVAPVELVGDRHGWVIEVRCAAVGLGEPDATGRARPELLPDVERRFATDIVVVAIGTEAHPLLRAGALGLDTDSRGRVVVDPETGSTSRPGVWAGGDVVTGTGTVGLAMGAGRRAARAIDAWLLERRSARSDQTSSGAPSVVEVDEDAPQARQNGSSE